MKELTNPKSIGKDMISALIYKYELILEVIK